MARNSYLIVTKELAANKTISATAKLLFAQLLDHRNGQTGQCNPWEVTLAREIGVSESTIFRSLRELRKAGMVEGKRTQRGNRYEFPTRQIDGSHPSNCMLPSRQIDGSGAPYPLYEPILREPNARARKRAADSLPNQNHKSNAAAVPRKSAASEILEAYQRLYEKKA